MLDISRAAFDFVNDIERLSDQRLLTDRFGRELHGYGYHAWMIASLPNAGGRTGSVALLGGWQESWTELYRRRNLIRNDPMVAHCFRSTAQFEWRFLGSRARSLLSQERCPGAACVSQSGGEGLFDSPRRGARNPPQRPRQRTFEKGRRANRGGRIAVGRERSHASNLQLSGSHQGEDRVRSGIPPSSVSRKLCRP